MNVRPYLAFFSLLAMSLVLSKSSTPVFCVVYPKMRETSSDWINAATLITSSSLSEVSAICSPYQPVDISASLKMQD
ncbi:hypothetical protein D3C73_896670 [compost metagenome]